MADQRQTFVVFRRRLHHHLGAERLPIAAHRRRGACVRLRRRRHGNRVAVEEIAARGLGAGLFGACDGMARHEVRRQRRERIDDGALDAADIKDERTSPRGFRRSGGDGAHRHRDAGGVAGDEGFSTFVDDAKRMRIAQRRGAAVHADHVLEEAARLGCERERAAHHAGADQQQGFAGALVFRDAHLPAATARSSAARKRAFSSGSPMVTRRWRGIP